jgi:hypothetical protein
MASATKTNAWFCNTINSSYTPPFNTITANAFSDTRLALDSKWIRFNSCFVEGFFKENIFKIFLLREAAT